MAKRRAMLSVDRENVDFAVLDLIGTVNPAGGSLCNSRTVVGVGAGVHQDFGFAGDQSSVTLHAGSDPACRRMAADGEHRFGNALRHPHGPAARLSRHGDDHGLDFEIGFSTEGAADVGNDDFDFGVGITEHVSELGPDQERMSRRGPERDAFPCHSGHRRVRFHCIVIDHGELIGFVDDLIRFGKAFRRIPFLKMFVMAYVGFLFLSHAGHLMKFTHARDIFMQQGRALRQRVFYGGQAG